jgi:hypothetical protein
MTRASLVCLAIVCLITVLAAPTCAQSTVEKRVALVIGIGDYTDPLLGKLEHPKSDAASIARQLKQLGFGNMLTALAQRESGTGGLDEAVTALQAAVTTYTRGDNPFDWASAQLGLANALALLGQRQSRTAQLEAAVVAYRKALEEDTRERVPLS